ncbi:unnamed protein product, partial [Urochloa humidicola]
PWTPGRDVDAAVPVRGVTARGGADGGVRRRAGRPGFLRVPRRQPGLLQVRRRPRLPSRAGMFVIYAPALAAALASFAVPGAVEGLRAQVLAAAVAVHFLKRVLEVLFVHRYSGSMPLGTALLISSCYLFNAVAMIYVQHLSH